ncbi:hypothetical protein [uncultured Nocardioides sp.]|uniref:NADase-type glycan-binding domain-containing protein n=1 Tax=uncultured Nocardioides sp. TaxID=198441 RepID=UPI002605A975|nr:hypothetical protein [uncultured Nocardioides sp.]
MSPSWSDWRTDTAERDSLPAVPADERDLVLTPYAPGSSPDETRSAAPLLVPAEPTGDLPRSPRWPLYADEPTTTATTATTATTSVQAATPLTGAAAGRRGGTSSRPVLPLVAAALAVTLAAGTGVWLGWQPDGAVTSDAPTAGRQVDDAAEPREGGTSRGEQREDQQRQDQQGRRDRADRTDRADRGARPPDLASRARRAAEPLTEAVTATAPSTAPPNEDLSGRTVSYAAPNMLDGRDETAWRMVGDGRGSVLTFTFEEPVMVTTVGLLNGYAKTGSTGGRDVDWYAGNRRVRQVEWFFDDGSRVVHTLRDTPQVQRTDIRPRTTSTVRLRLTRVSGPGGGPDRRDYTAISEVALDGVPRSSLD